MLLSVEALSPLPASSPRSPVFEMGSVVAGARARTPTSRRCSAGCCRIAGWTRSPCASWAFGARGTELFTGRAPAGSTGSPYTRQCAVDVQSLFAAKDSHRRPRTATRSSSAQAASTCGRS